MLWVKTQAFCKVGKWSPGTLHPTQYQSVFRSVAGRNRTNRLPTAQGMQKWPRLSVLGVCGLMATASPHCEWQTWSQAFADGTLLDPISSSVFFGLCCRRGSQLSLSSLSPYAPSWLREETPGVWGVESAAFLFSGAPVGRTSQVRPSHSLSCLGCARVQGRGVCTARILSSEYPQDTEIVSRVKGH